MIDRQMDEALRGGAAAGAESARTQHTQAICDAWEARRPHSRIGANGRVWTWGESYLIDWCPKSPCLWMPTYGSREVTR